MSNMSYCRFENTLADLEDCLQALADGVDVSETEKRAADRMAKVCQQYIEEHISWSRYEH